MYSENGKYPISVCFSPQAWPLFKKDHALVLIVDIFRATTSICTALHNQVKSIIPVAEISESIAYGQQGYLIAGERDGKKLECAHFGNSPFNFIDPSLQGKTIVFNTTNGTQAIREASQGHNEVCIGAFTNLEAIGQHILNRKKEVIVFCAGWKNRFSLEDSLFAGAIVQYLIGKGKGDYHTTCDSAIACADLWSLAGNNLPQYIEKAAHRHRLQKMGLDDVIEYCLSLDTTPVVPVLVNNKEIVDYNKQAHTLNCL